MANLGALSSRFDLYSFLIGDLVYNLLDFFVFLYHVINLIVNNFDLISYI